MSCSKSRPEGKRRCRSLFLAAKLRDQVLLKSLHSSLTYINILTLPFLFPVSLCICVTVLHISLFPHGRNKAHINTALERATWNAFQITLFSFPLHSWLLCMLHRLIYRSNEMITLSLHCQVRMELQEETKQLLTAPMNILVSALGSC